jgi:hypothetical protein
VALSPHQALRPVVAVLATAQPSGLQDLTVDHARARVPVTPVRLAHRPPPPVVLSPEPSLEAPLAEVVVDALPRGLLSGQHAPRAGAPQKARHTVGDPPGEYLVGRLRFTGRL